MESAITGKGCRNSCASSLSEPKTTPGRSSASYWKKDREMLCGGSSAAPCQGQGGQIPVCVSVFVCVCVCMWGRPVERQGVVITQGRDGGERRVLSASHIKSRWGRNSF